jgi:prevent-host-death family protein
MSERTVSIAEAKAHLSELIAAGEQVVVTKRGVPVATILPRPKPKKKLDLAWLEEATKDTPYQQEDSGTLLRRMRDDYRY